MITDVETIQRAGRAARYAGTGDRSDIDDIAQLAGEENVNRESALPQVKDSGGRWVTLQPGWAVLLLDGGMRIVSSAEAYQHGYRERGQ